MLSLPMSHEGMVILRNGKKQNDVTALSYGEAGKSHYLSKFVVNLNLKNRLFKKCPRYLAAEIPSYPRMLEGLVYFISRGWFQMAKLLYQIDCESSKKIRRTELTK
jgi:hypothetical protein